MTQPGTAATARRTGIFSFTVLVIVLFGVLGFLFGRAMLPDYTVFSNDGPLGAISSRSAAMPAGYTGAWSDLNWLGGAGLSASPNLSSLLVTVSGPLFFSKVFAPFSLLFVGLCAWFCCRRFGLSPLAAVLTGIATALNGDFLPTACWGVCSQPIAFGFSFLALAALADTESPWRWLAVVLAGFAVGMGVMEAFDIGALFSLFVAAFVVYQSFATDGALAKRAVNGVGRLILVAGFAGFIAATTLSTLIGTQIKGVVGMSQDAATKAARWHEATQWSLPKREALGFVVPGLFGYRMDTPNGGAYWGRVGSDPRWDAYLASDRTGPPPANAFFRYGGGGGYVGALVLIVAAWALLQAFRGEHSVFNRTQRRLLWFWLAVLGVTLLLSFGRHAPFFQFFYALPYASTIRNPIKFTHIFDWALLIVFAYGLDGLCRRYLHAPGAVARDLQSQWRMWWSKVTGFDRRWVQGSLVVAGLGVLAWFIYAQQGDRVASYLAELARLENIQRGQPFDLAAATQGAQVQAGFSVRAVGWFLAFFIPGLGLMTLILSGYFAGRRARVAGILLGLLLTLDLARFATPWVIIYNWKEKYIEAGDNPVIAFLRQKPHEHRAALLRIPWQIPQLAFFDDYVYGVEWKQHLFQYFNIQSPDIVQMPRVPVEVEAFESALTLDPARLEATLYRVPRRWQLMNTRHLLGPVAFQEVLNEKVDAEQKRFRILMQFEFYQTREGGPVLCRTNSTGPFALYEFTGALPRVKLYGNWQVNTNAAATLQALASREFDPQQTVLVADAITPSAATNANAGSVEFVSYAPKHIVLKANAATPAVLLLNDKYDAHWQVTVDGQPSPLLRCNYVMRGVQLAAGEHRVEFRYRVPLGGLYISLSAVALGVILIGILAASARRDSNGDSAKAKKHGKA